MKEIVKYHNDLNKLKLPSFTEQEQNLLFTILTKIKNFENRTIRLFRNDLMPEKMESTDYFTSIVNSLRFKFFKATFSYIIETETHTIDRTINLFNTMDIHYQKKNPQDGLDTSKIVECIDFKVNPDFAYLVNELTANFTRFELAEFIALSGKYTKTLYRLLKQYRQTGFMRMEWDEFARVMDIPQDYSQTNIDKWILKPAIKELTAERNLFDTKRIPFEKLTYTKLKGKSRGRGGNVIGIEFSFKKEEKEAIEQDIYTDFVEKHKEKSFFFKGYGIYKLKGLGRNAEGERILVFDSDDFSRISDKVSNYPTKASLKKLEKLITI